MTKITSDSMINLDQIYKHKPNLVWRDVDDGVVIVSPAGGEVRALNQLGSAIWTKLDGSNTAGAILESLADRFPSVPQTKLQDDLNQFITSLLERGMLTLIEEKITDQN